VPGWVHCTYRWLVGDDTYLRAIALRHELDDFLFEAAGYIGYSMVSSFDLAHLGAITVPVLEIVGGGDQLFPASAGRRQAGLFTGSSAVELVTVPGAGHAITLQRRHDAFTGGMRTWLESVDGFAAPPIGGVETGIGDTGTNRTGLLGAGLVALAGAAGVGAAFRRRATRTGSAGTT